MLCMTFLRLHHAARVMHKKAMRCGVSGSGGVSTGLKCRPHAASGTTASKCGPSPCTSPVRVLAYVLLPQTIKELFTAIITHWNELKHTRAQQGFANTSLQVVVYQEHGNPAEDKEQYVRVRSCRVLECSPLLQCQAGPGSP